MEFDQRIAALNAEIVAAHDSIQKYYQQHHEFPRKMEEAWLDVSPRDEDINKPWARNALGEIYSKAMYEGMSMSAP
jgi:hypothetical protein